MGTDIHLFAEKFNKETGFWELTRGTNPRIQDRRDWAKIHRESGRLEEALRYEKEADELESGARVRPGMEAWESDWYGPKVAQGWVYDGRNYNLFAILADVRNGRGFGGVKTGEGFNPISLPKGLPDVLSDELRDLLHEDSYYHSMSYLTLKELIDYDWEQGTVQYGVVSEHTYREMKEQGKKSPDTWSGGVGGGMVVQLSTNEMDDLIAGKLERDPDKNYYTRVSWKDTYAEAVGDFFMDVSLQRLKDLSETMDGEDVRIVFGFDS